MINPRTSTRMRPPPVRIGLAQAAVRNATMQVDASNVSSGAAAFGARRGVYASVGPRLRIDRGSGPNNPTARQGLIAMGHTRRKKGFPPITATGE